MEIKTTGRMGLEDKMKVEKKMGNVRCEALGYRFRSMLEHDYAQYLHYWAERKVVKSWLYEPRVFDFAGVLKARAEACEEKAKQISRAAKGLVSAAEVKDALERTVGWLAEASGVRSAITDLGRVRRYVPDFQVFDPDGSHHWVECKGQLDSASVTKLIRMAELFPDERFVVVLTRFAKGKQEYRARRLRALPTVLTVRYAQNLFRACPLKAYLRKWS